MKYREEFIKLNDQIHKHIEMPHQITIDIFEDFNEEFIIGRDLDEKPIERDELGEVLYDIDVLLEAMNPTYEYDISSLKKLTDLLTFWYKEIEFRNEILGIPKHKG